MKICLCVIVWYVVPANCMHNELQFRNISDCFFKSQKYLGQVSISQTNKKCQPWSVKLQSNAAMASTFPDRSITDAKNYCRDPDGKGHPWCFVSVLADDQGWEFCNVKYCAGK